MSRRGIALALALTLLGGCAPALRSQDEGASYLTLAEPLPPADAWPLVGRTVVLDPGHGGAETGAVGPTGLLEKDVNLAVALELARLLRAASASVSLTRTGDTAVATGSLAVDLRARAEVGNAARADLFLSIHHNATMDRGNARVATETYYRLDDGGASLDAAAAIHQSLQRNLRLPADKLMPGMYAVLRASKGAAVLGEASYLSNPRTEALLRDPAKLRLEAQAYFLGILDYFARGVPLVATLGQARETDPDRPVLVARFRGAVAPGSLAMTLDGSPITPVFDPEDGTVLYQPPAPLAAGPHVVTLTGANLLGNHAPLVSYHFGITRRASTLDLTLPWSTPPRDGPLPVVAMVRDRWGLPVADGTEITWSSTAGRLLLERTRTRAGRTVAYLLGAGPRTRITAVADDSEATLEIMGAPAPHLHGHVDAGGAPLEGVTVLALGVHGWRMARTGVDGSWWLESPPRDLKEIRYLKPGYQPRAYALREPRYVPVSLATASLPLGGQVIVLNPEGGPEGRTLEGRQQGLANHRTASLVRGYLEAAGAEVLLTRARDEDPGDIRRVRLVAEADAALMLTLGHHERGGWRSSHYPSSVRGQAIARSLRETLLRLLPGAPDGGTAPDSSYTLIQTRCPSVTLSLPPLNEQEAWKAAYGILLALTPEAPGATVTVSVSEAPGKPAAHRLVSLDGVWHGQTDARGQWRYERVEPGSHLITVGGERPARAAWLNDLRAGEQRTLEVDLARPPVPEDLSLGRVLARR